MFEPGAVHFLEGRVVHVREIDTCDFSAQSSGKRNNFNSRVVVLA